MKGQRLVLVVLLVVLLSGSLFAAKYFETQAQFVAYLDTHDYELNDIEAGVDFYFGIGELTDEFFILTGGDWEEVTVEEGTQIEFGTDVELVIDGSLVVGDAEDPTITLISGYLGARWNSIVLRGDGEEGTGVGTFHYCTISGGGDDGGHGGLIALTNTAEDETTPILTLNHCNLMDSESDGIYIYDVDCDDDDDDDVRVISSIILTETTITGSAQSIDGNGIHYQAWCDESVPSNLQVTASTISYCDGCGILHDECRSLNFGDDPEDEDDDEPGFILTINQESEINNNNQDGVKFICPVIESEDWDFMVDYTTMFVDLDDSQFNYNGQDLEQEG
jgi:hypothetical protein